MRQDHQLVTNALNLLTRGLGPYVSGALETIYRDRWEKIARESFRDVHSLPGDRSGGVTWDAQSLLTVMWDQWNSVFRHKLGHAERSLVSELRAYRNRWAHQSTFDFDDTYRVLDSVQRLLLATGSPLAHEAGSMKRDRLRQEFTGELRAAEEKAKLRLFRYRSAVTYGVCALAVAVAFFSSLGPVAVSWWLSAAVLMLAVYFIWEVLATRPAIFSPHECLNCRKIIYTEPCPYCAMTPGPESDGFGDSDPELDAVTESEPVGAPV